MSTTRVVTLLSLVPEKSDVPAELLDLLASIDAQGISTRIAIDPKQLALAIEDMQETHVVIVDGGNNPDHDLFRLIWGINLRRLGVIALVESHAQRLEAVAAGADICLRLPIHKHDFLIEILDLLEYYAPDSTRFHDMRTADAGAAPVLETAREPTYFYGTTNMLVGTDADNKTKKGGATQGRLTSKKPSTVARPRLDMPWMLTDKGWTLSTPNGRSISLSSRESLFLNALFNSDENSLTRERWMALCKLSPEKVTTSRTLTVVVSQLRSKCRAVGCDLPIRADWRNGYVFTESCIGLPTTRRLKKEVA